MKSSILKKILSVSMASLTAFSTFSGSVLTKVYASKSEMQWNFETPDSSDEDSEEYCAVFSHRGFTYILYFDQLIEDESDEKLVIQIMEMFNSVMDPFDERIPESKLRVFTCQKDTVLYKEIKKILLVKSYVEQKKLLENLVDDLLLMATFSYQGFNIMIDFTNLLERGLDKESAKKFVEVFNKVVGPYDEKIQGFKMMNCQSISPSKFCKFVKEVFLTESHEEQEEWIRKYLDDAMLRVNCSYGGYNFIINFSQLVKMGVDRESIVRFVLKFKEIMINNPYDLKITGDKVIGRTYVSPDRFNEWMKNIFAAKSDVEQRKLIESKLDRYIKLESSRCLKGFFKGFNFNIYYSMTEDESIKKMVDEFEEMSKEIMEPYNEKMAEKKEINCMITTDKFMIDFSSKKTPEEKKEFIKNFLNHRVIKTIARSKK